MSIPPQDEPSINQNVPVQVNKISSSCEICSGPHDTQYFMKDTKQAFVEYASSCNDKMGAHMHLASTDHIKEKELQKKGIKSPSKLLSPKYLSRASLEELNKNLLSLKCVYFINSIIILSKKKSEAKGKGIMKPNEAECNDHKRTVEAKEEVEEESEKALEEETKEETKEEEEDDPKYFDTLPTMEELRYHEWLLKNP
uniref:Uncharacterized protein n=1 Tax=Tanacetum cinerariifolium TaxID=118510 RepID=A0A699JX20_TANCI|nr:hypothetical protein [Tanacetum cinerariifolium]